jgi:hypothetical protein
MKNLEELLNDTDFSQDSRNKEPIKARLLVKFAKGEISMKKFKLRQVYVAAAAVFAVGITIAACGEDIGDFAKKIVQQFTVGKYATFVAGDDTVNARSNVKETQSVVLETDEGVIMVGSRPAVFNYEAEIEREKGTVTYFDTINDVKPYLAFNPLMPVFLPDGFAIDRICLFNDENGGPLPLGSNMYLEVYYTDAAKTRQIYMQLRLMNEETGFTASAGRDMRHITLNGHKGVVDGNNVHIEIDGVMYMILADYAGVTQKDVVMMAETLK